MCVHGACVDGTFFDGIACELSHNYRVIAYDRRGCGGSSEAADGSYDLAAQAADLQAVIEHVGAPTNVLAHSAGTLVALELLRIEPHLVARAILHEPAVSAEGVGMGAAPILLDMIAAGKVSRALRLFLGARRLGPRAPGTTEAEANMPCAMVVALWPMNTEQI
ncbi:MAG: alpha/beta fold hydrolase [Collinsella sp.]